MNQPFPRMFATQTAHEGPVDLFKSLHEARAWVARIQNAPSLPRPLPVRSRRSRKRRPKRGPIPTGREP